MRLLARKREGMLVWKSESGDLRLRVQGCCIWGGIARVLAGIGGGDAYNMGEIRGGTWGRF